VHPHDKAILLALGMGTIVLTIILVFVYLMTLKHC
jgi:hypothetical protein